MSNYKSNIIDILENGKVLAKLDNKVVFLDDMIDDFGNTIPSCIDDYVEFIITKEKKNYSLGKIIKILKFSSSRVKPPCKYFNECGGCSLMHMNIEKQRKLKENHIKNKLHKFAKLELSGDIKTLTSCDLNYRNKITLKYKNKKLGYFRRKTHTILDIDSCMIASIDISNSIFLVKKFIIEIESILNVNLVGDIVIRQDNLNELHILFDFDKKINSLDKDYLCKIWKNLSDTDDVVPNMHFSVNKNIYLSTNKKSLDISIKNYNLKLSPNSFYQVNKFIAPLIPNLILDLIKELKKTISYSPKILDLYCGTGSTTVFFTEVSDNVVGVEVDSAAVEFGNKNIDYLGLSNKASLVCDKAENFISNVFCDANIIFVDPPRSGMDIKVIDAINLSNVDYVILMSCDAATLSRDIFALSNFSLVDLIFVDMFPHSLHVESVVLLTKVHK